MTTPTTYASTEAAIRDGLDSMVAYASHRPNINMGTADRETLVEILVEALSRVAKPQPAAVGGDAPNKPIILPGYVSQALRELLANIDDNHGRHDGTEGCRCCGAEVAEECRDDCGAAVLRQDVEILDAWMADLRAGRDGIGYRTPAPSAPPQPAAVGAHPRNYHYGPEPATDPMAIVGRFCWEKRANGDIGCDMFGDYERLAEFIPRPSLPPEMTAEEVAEAMRSIEGREIFRDYATPAPSAKAQAVEASDELVHALADEFWRACRESQDDFLAQGLRSYGGGSALFKTALTRALARAALAVQPAAVGDG